MRSSDPYLLEPYPTNIVHLMQERLMVFHVNPKRITAKNIEAAVDNLASPKDAEIFYMRYKEHFLNSQEQNFLSSSELAPLWYNSPKVKG